MKKNIFLFLLIISIMSCSTRKNRFVNRTYHNFTTYYNTLFHGQEALKSELKEHKLSYKDNFHEGYIDVLAENNLIEESEDAYASEFFNNSLSQQTSANLEKAEQKALKAIDKHSMELGGMQRNKEIFNAYILLAKSRMYQGKLQEALEPLNRIYQTMSKDKRVPLAKIYEGLIYSKLNNNIRAEELFYEVENNYNLRNDYKKTLSIYQANNLIASNRKEEALSYLEKAFELNKSRQIKSRIAFLRGQILLDLGKNEEARESFVSAYKLSNKIEFEVKSQIEIAKTFSNGDDYQEAKKYLEDISKKGIYTPYKNEFYYALGIISKNAGKEKEANDFFKNSIKEKISDPHIRGLAYYEIGKSYFNKQEYIKAGRYYDSAEKVIEHIPTKEKMKDLVSNINNLSKNYYLIKQNDSIIALTKMTDNERTEFFQKYIDSLKVAESKKEIVKNNKNKNSKEQINAYYDSNIDFQTFSDNFGDRRSKKFYFDNEINVAKGINEFKKIWGNRPLNDNWRYNANQISNNDLSNDKIEQEFVKNDNNSRRFELSYYLEKIPTEDSIILDLKKSRDTASLGLGRMYETYFQNTDLATKTLYDLVDNRPEKDIKLQALYLIFSFNHEKYPENAVKAKNMIIDEFPDTPYAVFVKNPRNTNFSESSDETKSIYQEAYILYSIENFQEAQEIVLQAIDKYPKDALIPKFELLKAFITGKTKGKEDMIFQLQEIVLNFEKTDEGIKAKEILNFLKSQEDTDSQKIEDNNYEEPKKEVINNNQKSINKSEIIEEKPSKDKTTPKKDNTPKKLKRPVQSWEKNYLELEE